MTALFLFNNILLGVGLAMDAFSVSIANGLEDPHMPKRRMCMIAGCYGFFQWLMPMTGWFCVHTVATYFTYFQRFIPWIALILLSWIGGKMLIEGIRKIRSKKVDAVVTEEKEEVKEGKKLGFGTLLIQGIATSIDALSVGFTIAEYGAGQAFGASLIIAIVTFAICMSGLLFGKKFGEKLADKASLVGGLILIGIGIEIFVSGMV